VRGPIRSSNCGRCRAAMPSMARIMSQFFQVFPPSACRSLPGGFSSFMPYFYVVFLTFLLVDRGEWAGRAVGAEPASCSVLPRIVVLTVRNALFAAPARCSVPRRGPHARQVRQVLGHLLRACALQDHSRPAVRVIESLRRPTCLAVQLAIAPLRTRCRAAMASKLGRCDQSTEVAVAILRIAQSCHQAFEESSNGVAVKLVVVPQRCWHTYASIHTIDRHSASTQSVT